MAAFLPVCLLVKRLGMLDNGWTIVIRYTSMNLPLAVWMMRSFLLEVPREVLEAGEVDGAGLLTSIRKIIVPVVSPGFISSEGLFLARLCAGATIVSLPVLVAGWLAQDKLVRGLSTGAVK